MLQPIDYVSGLGKLPNPTEQINAGIQSQQDIRLGDQKLAANDFALMQAQEKAKREEQYRLDVQGALLSGKTQDISTLLLKYPEFKDSLKAAYDQQDERAKVSDLQQAASVWSALNAGKTDVAIKILEDRDAADTAAGQPDEDDREALALLKSGDPKGIAAVKGMLGLHMAAVVPDKFAAVTEQLGSGRDGRKVLSPGQILLGEDNQPIFSAPFAPRPVTVGEGQTVVEYQPGGGDPASPVSGPQIEQIALSAVPGAVVTSRQRDPAKNQAVGGKPNSYHLTDQARDLVPPQGMAMGAFASSLKQAFGPGYDVINEGDHVHVEPSSRGGPRVIAQGGGKPNYTLLSTQEKQSLGLPEDVAFQRSPDGKVEAISGQSKNTAQAKSIPNAAAKPVEDAVGNLVALKTSAQSFRPEYGGYTVTGGLTNQIQSVANVGPEGQRDWWANFQSTDNLIRNSLFGSALTEGERKAYEATTISPRMAPAQIKKNLVRRASIIEGALNRKKKFFKANRYDPEAVDALFDTGMVPAEAAPVRVSSIQQAQRLAPGTLYIRPDGQVMRR